MSRRTKTILITLCLLSAMNAVALVLNLSWPAGAAVRGMSHQDLMRDLDFTRAVKTIQAEVPRGMIPTPPIVLTFYFPAARVRMAVINWDVVWLETAAWLLAPDRRREEEEHWQ